MNFGLSDDTVKKFKSVFAKYPQIEEVVIYGSRAKGNYREGSDIDLTLKGENLSHDFASKVWLDIDELNTPYLVDISVFSQLVSDGLRKHILRAGKTFYKSSQLTAPSK